MEYAIRPCRAGEEQYVADAHRRIYAEEYRWGDAFIRYAQEIALDFPRRGKCEREELWVAEADGKLIGCIMLCQGETPDVGQLRLFLVEKEYRGHGVGKALTTALMARVQQVGYQKLMLWTASPLHDAIRQYERMGFVATDRVANTDWSLDGQTVYEVRMDKELA